MKDVFDVNLPAVPLAAIGRGKAEKLAQPPKPLRRWSGKRR